jgi:membrane-bound lytic murein transglycosylase D
MALNNLTPPASLAVGQVLVLKSREWQPVAPPAPAAPARAATPANRRTNPAIYVPRTAASPAASVPVATMETAIQHTVAKGETLYSIARRYEVKVADLQAWNGKLDGSVKIGEVLQVKPSAR